MNESRRGLRASHWTMILTAIIAVLGLLMVLMLFPRYRSTIVTVDNQHRWQQRQAPPRREIVWQPAEPVKPDSLSAAAAESHIRPQLSADGDFLFFAIRTADHDLDIVRSKRTQQGWSEPEPVGALNTSFDDVGPIIRGDDQTLYLYSNRQGGFGGMDIYVSHRQGQSWSTPVNLGEKINSPAHEYDPAISPDAKRLYFSSNRSAQMQRQWADGNFDQRIDYWPTTLRHDPGNRTFDLYSSQLDSESKQWKQAQPLPWLNTPQYNEGAPFVSPDGAFLLFVSDRPDGKSDPLNFDLYRARIDRPDRHPENLGAGINTPANEIEPCLADAGFTLLFSRSDAENRAQYHLFQSTAKEIFHDAQWDRSNLNALGGTLGSVVQQIYDRMWLILLILAAIASLIYLIRQIAVRRVAVSGFLIAALMLHLLLVSGSFFVYFQQSLAKKLKEMFADQTVVATQVLLSSTNPAPTEQTSFAAATSLDMPAPIQPADASRREIDSSSEPLPIELANLKNIANQTPVPAQFDGQPAMATVSVADPPESIDHMLPRSTLTPQQPNESVRLATTVAVDLPAIEPIADLPQEVQRQTLEPVDERLKQPELKDLVVDNEPLATEALQPRRFDSESMPIESKPAEISLSRASLDDSDPDDLLVNPTIPAEQVTAFEVQSMKVLVSENVRVDRDATVAGAAVAQPEPLELAKVSDALLKPVRSDNDLPTVVADERDIAKDSAMPASPLKRALASTPPRTSERETNAAVQIEPIRAASPDSEPARNDPAIVVKVARQAETNPPLSVDTLAMVPHAAAAMPTGISARLLMPLRSEATGAMRADPLDQLVRRQSSPLFADVKVNLQSLLQRRTLDEATKLEVVKEFGGNDQTLAAIRRGLNWMAKHQAADGHWGLNDFNQLCKDHQKCSGHGGSKSATAGTGLALLPFLGDGNTHQQGPYKEFVNRGIGWLIKHQKPDGNLFTAGENNAFMYSHGIATIALCECYGMTGDAQLRDPAQRAIDFIVAAQDPKTGGWRYRPREQGDTSVVGWQVMALKSGQMADLNVPAKSLKEAQRWLESVAGEKNRVGQFAYQRNHNFNPAMTAEAILCLEYLDQSRDSEYLHRGPDYLLGNLPKKNRETSYYWYYGTQAMFHLQGEHWQRWNQAIHPLLIESQRQDGPMAGTWDPRDQWERSGGRIYATSLKILMLEVYYRHLPLYQVIE